MQYSNNTLDANTLDVFAYLNKNFNSYSTSYHESFYQFENSLYEAQTLVHFFLLLLRV